MNSCVVVHYHEIALKGGNRLFFEKKLIENIKKTLHGLKYKKIERHWGRILIDLGENGDFKKIKPQLKKVFGIAYFFEAIRIDSEFENLKNKSLEIFKKDNKEIKFKTFKIESRRANKKYKLNSQEINRKIGEHILNNTKGFSVSLNDQEYTLYIDIIDNNKSLIYSKKIRGVGGLPSGVSGEAVSLISSGFDSPVASWQIMRRGARVVFVHFHSYPQTSKASLNNVEKIVRVLNQYQFKSILYFVPFLNIQKEIHLKCQSSLKVILYRRIMIRIAEEIAGQEKCRALVTGESLGQVASQTIENIAAINEIATLPILRPLVGTDKEEIINQAREIDTFEISSVPYEDCCSLFVPKHPETKARMEDVLREENKLNIDEMVNGAIEKMNKVFIRS